MVALAEFGVTKEELTSRNLITAQKPDPVPGYLKRLEKSLVANPTAHMVDDPDGKFLIVQGQLHFYRMFRTSGRIERATDNAVLELDWHSLPDQFRVILNAECDSEQQLRLRAFLLTNDSVFARYFTVVH